MVGPRLAEMLFMEPVLALTPFAWFLAAPLGPFVRVIAFLESSLVLRVGVLRSLRTYTFSLCSLGSRVR